MIRTRLALVAFLTLTGCGGEGGGGGNGNANRSAVAPPPPATVTPDPADAYANSEAAMQICRTARQAYVAQGRNDESTYISTLEEIAAASEPCALYGLGLLYVTGYEQAGVSPDPVQARIWLQQAADLQHLPSIALLKELNKK